MTDTPKSPHRVDRSYAISLAITVTLIVTLVVGTYRQSNHARDRAERSEDQALAVAGLLRNQLAAALEQLAQDADKAKCRDTLTSRVADRSADNAVAFNRYVIGLGTGPRDNLAVLQAALDQAGLDLVAAQQVRALAVNNDYASEFCPAPGG